MSFPIFRTAVAAAAAVCAAGLVPASARAGVSGADAGPFTVKSASVELPDSSRPFSPGPGMDTVTANCTGCHSSGMILNQPNLSRTAWEGEVKKMVSVYKAPVEASDVPAIVAYLAAVKGP